MASARTLRWLDRTIWTLVYLGLFAVVLGIATGSQHEVAGWTLGVVGAALAVAGFALIFVRARLREDAPAPGAQSTHPQQGPR